MKIRQLSLRNKLVGSAVICLLIPLIVVYLVTNYLTRDLILDKAISTAEDTLKVSKSDVNRVFDQMLEISNFVLMNNEIRQMLLVDPSKLGSAENRADTIISSSRLSRFLDDLVLPNKDFYVTILGENNYIYTSYSYSDYNPVQLYEQNWFSELDNIPNFSTYWLGQQNIYYNKSDLNSSNWVTIGRPIKTTAANPIGYVVVTVNERIIHPYLTQSSDQDTFLLDDDGVVVSHVDSTKIGEKMSWWKEDESSKTIEIDGAKYIYVAQDLDSNNWRIVSLISLSSAVAKNKHILFVSFAVQVLFSLVFFVLLTLLISRFTKPIANLIRFVKKIGRGQLDLRSGISGQNEVAHLAGTIDYMLDQIQSMIEQITVEQTKKRKAELEMLQAQINPHFMFNLLNSIRLNILIQGDKESAELIGSLSSLLRMTFNRDNEFIPLEEEVDTVSHYVRLMNFRHANQVRFEVKFASEQCGDARVPRFMIQPLIENAIIHGFEQFDGEIFIDANIRENNGSELLQIFVRDNGIGMTEDKLNGLQAKLDDYEESGDLEKKGFSGIGVKNVVQRLRLIYGDQLHVDIQSEHNVGTEITLEFPLEIRE
ncbi:sensor histidine kinase [Paenibacillus anaericanus]|uniref:Sensor histidine kinase n=1 Tax=Paenibacillus anaericanus TaxID=170367 RepID=A0A433Y8H6_9BACL|nr:sensor histidine kinase [Paenibacillus anaericanus]RUT46224.1 sensor histidine kinase [Paenibacillus anaericanus]